MSNGSQVTLFNSLRIKIPIYEKKSKIVDFYVPQLKDNVLKLQNRRYIGNKYKLTDWIFSIIKQECTGNCFADIFAGTGTVSARAAEYFDKIIINDFLHSNHAVYQAFFSKGYWNKEKINDIIRSYNEIKADDLNDNYFSEYFGNKYFSKDSAKIIGNIRENIEEIKKYLTSKEYYILIASLLYSIDKIANTVGHYDAYFKKNYVEDDFLMRSIESLDVSGVSIFKEDANLLVKKIKADIIYIDPPYNSRQYSRFYHILETLTKWDKPKLYGTALKPDPENMSDYCKVNARERFSELIKDINAKYIVVSYNNTYNSKSNSSRNKITLKEIRNIMAMKGETRIFAKEYKHFNAGNTNFNNHKEYLFVTKVKHE